MAKKRIIKIVLRLQKSKAYRILEKLYSNGLFVESLSRKIQKYFILLKRRISNILRKMRQRNESSEKKMYFYRLISKFMPAFIKAWRLDF